MPSNRAAAAYILAHPTRQRILGLVKGGKALSANEICLALDLPLETVGLHMVALEQHGLLLREMEYANPRVRAEARFTQSDSIRETIEALRDLL